ncbi:hypothetical protein GCM10027431_32650 [Lysobacter rhizosphaerae]
MSDVKLSRKWLLLGVLLSTTAIAAGPVSVDGRELPYSQLNNIRNSSVYEEVELRQAALFEAAGAYRTLHGSTTLGGGSRLRLTYSDGTSEVGYIPAVGGTPIPVTGSQCSANGDCGTNLQPK